MLCIFASYNLTPWIKVIKILLFVRINYSCNYKIMKRAISTDHSEEEEIKPTTSENVTHKAKKAKLSKPRSKKSKAAAKLDSSVDDNNKPVDNSDDESIYSNRDDSATNKLFGIEEKKGDPYNLGIAHFNIQHLVIDEICLEGLDGITLEALWKRLSDATQFNLPFSDAIRKYVFDVIKSRDDINFYCLEEPRSELIIYDRYEHFDSVDIVDIYPYRGINEKNVMGSCSTFDTRKDITCEAKQQTLEELESLYGSRLVIVAAQRIRLKSILNKLMDPTIELSPNQYCMLERIARSRYHGEVTHGKMSLQIITKDTKHLFYNRKILGAYFLVMKQPFYVQTYNSAQVNAILMHLPRFYNKQKTRTQIMTEQIVEVLRSAPMHKMEHSAIKEIFGNTKSLNKLCKMQEFQKFVKYGVDKYRDLYPNATPEEWKVKSHGGEKVIRTLNLIDPLVNVSGAWNEEESKDESSEEEDENEYYPNVPVLHQINKYVKSSGLNGRSIKEMTCNKGLGFYTVRSSIKQQVTKNFIVGVKIDIGRSRYIKYHSNSTDIDLKDDLMVNDEPMDDMEEKSSQFVADLLGVNVSCLNSTSNGSCEAEQRVKQKKGNYEKISIILPSHLETPTNISLNDKNGINLCFSLSSKLNTKTKVTGEELFFKIQKLKNDNDLHSRKILNACNYEKWCAQTLFMVKSILEHFNYKVQTLSPYANRTGATIEEICELPSKGKVNILTTKVISLPSTSSSTDHQIETLNVEKSSKVKRKAEFIECNTVKRMRIDTTHGESILIARMYMGPNPTEVYKQTDKDNIEVTILVSSTPEEFQSSKSKYPYLKENNLTQKTINRLNCILQMVREQHVVIDINNLKKLIMAEELKEGYKTQVDSKSIYRILTRLAMSGDIKILLVNLRLFKKRRHIFIVVEPFVNFDNSLIQSSIEKTKLRLYVESKRKRTDSVKVSTNVKKNAHKNKKVLYPNEKLHTTSIKGVLPYKYNPKASQAYGKRAKFAKMRILHEFMYYLIYDCSCERNVDLNSDLQDSPTVYHDEVGWKMFIPPLPKQVNWCEGWALTSDLIFRIPVSLLLKIHNVPFVIPELRAILAHPVKQHYLVKNLPIHIRNVILYRRKYISSIFDILTRLCYIGLLQFGPKQYCEKDQTMIYLNRKASLLDTVKSKPGYHLIEEKEYPKMEFVFTSKEIVENYWFEMLNICMSTKLGVRNAVMGAYIICEDISKKDEMVNIVKPQSAESVLIRDNGITPGDGLGAAGLDSALWAHLRRNWTISQNRPKVITKQYGNGSGETVVKESKPPILKKKRRVEVRKIVPRKDIKTDKIKYDEIDRKLMLSLKQRRPPWTEEEEKVLYICKIVTLFLSQTHTKQSITSQVIRDVCHALCLKCRNKTSQACHRKIIAIFDKCEQQKYLHKISKNLCLAPYVRKYFQIIFNRIHSNEVFPINHFSSAFVFLVIHFFENQQEIQHVFENIAPLYNLRIKVNKNNKTFSHPTFERINIGNSSVQILTYDSIDPKMKGQSSGLPTFPKVENDIKVETIKSLIQVGIENLHEFDVWRYQLYLLYDSYPSELLRRAEAELKDIRMISIPKTAKLKSEAKKIMPAFSKLYQFSNYYLYRRAKRVKFPPRIFIEAHEMLLEILKQKKNFVNFKNELLMDYFKQGHSVGLAELAVFLPVAITLDIPKTVLELNSNVDDHIELIRELAIRYKDMLSQLKEDVSTNKKNNQDESEKVRYICRKPMLRRFIKSWFMSDEEEEEPNENVEESAFVVENNDTEDVENIESEKTTQAQSSIPITFDNFEGFEQQLEVLLNSTKDLPENETLFDNIIQPAEESVEPDYQQPIIVNSTVVEECTPSQPRQVEENILINLTDTDCSISTVEHQNNEKDKLNLIKINLKQFEKHKDVTDARLEYLLNDSLTVEEIMEEMVKDCPEEERKIPKATNLIRLLINSPELDNSGDEKKMDRLRDHFVIKAPSTKLHIPNFTSAQFHYFENEHRQICDKLLDKVKTSIVVNNKIPSDEDIKIKFESLGVHKFDIKLILDLVTFVSGKLVLGASMKDITEIFVNFESIKLCDVLRVLTKINVLVQVGINYIVYVHFDYKNPWLIRTCNLIDIKAENYRSDNAPKSKMVPWSRIDGSLNLKAFNSWFLTVFGLCLDNCEGSLYNVITECSFLKPVEVYYLVECLQELGCIRMIKYNYQTVDLFSTTTISESVPADETVPFEDVYLEVLDNAIIKFGAFINKDLKEYDFTNENNLDYGTF